MVAVNSDRSVRELKGAGRPYWPLERRMLNVRAFAEAVIPFEGREELLIMQIRPDVVIKGADHSPDLKVMAARGIGWKDGVPVWSCPVVHIDRLPGISTTLAAHARETDA